jgi:hypothetical protein
MTDLTGVIHDGTSEQFSKVIREEKLKKRSEKVVELVKDEENFVGKLQILHEKFVLTLKTQIKDGYPILKEVDLNTIFSVYDKILESHKQYNCHDMIRDIIFRFLQTLSSEVKGWDLETSQLGPYYLELFVGIQGNYTKYTDNYTFATARLQEVMNTSLHFVTFLIQKESEVKITLSELLEVPLKRISNYYLHLEVFKEANIAD